MVDGVRPVLLLKRDGGRRIDLTFVCIVFRVHNTGLKVSVHVLTFISLTRSYSKVDFILSDNPKGYIH